MGGGHISYYTRIRKKVTENRQTDRQTYRQTDRQTNKQTNREFKNRGHLIPCGLWIVGERGPQGIRWPLFLNSLFVCLSVCLSVLSKFSNLFLQYKAAALQKNVLRMNTDVFASYTQNIAQGKKNDSRINAVYSGWLVVLVWC